MGAAAPTCVEAILALAGDITAHASLVVADIDGKTARPPIWLLSTAAGTSATTSGSLTAWAALVRRHTR